MQIRSAIEKVRQTKMRGFAAIAGIFVVAGIGVLIGYFIRGLLKNKRLEISLKDDRKDDR